MSASPGPQADAVGPPARKPRFALFVATACGLGYAPIAPGTFGSLAGIAVYCGTFKLGELWIRAATRSGAEVLPPPETVAFVLECVVALALVFLGVWSSDRVAAHSGIKDPQIVVLDEVSGQQLSLLLATKFGTALSWKYLLLGFILFRLFDIWKPFPARQAESLPGGWGIMADDWIAAVYAGIGLWIARAMGL